MTTMNLAKHRTLPKTHEGGTAKRIDPEQQLRRSLMACMLWEDAFYEDGRSIADRIREVVPKVSAEVVAELAVECRSKGKLRHAPLWLACAMLEARGEHQKRVRRVLAEIIQRPDELAEILAMWWKDERRPIPKQLQRGIADAWPRFDAYQFAKWEKTGKAFALRDILRLSHPKPADDEQRTLWRGVRDQSLPTPLTWETELSAGKDKCEVFSRLLTEDKLGALALLRNLRNMENAGVDRPLVRAALRAMKVERILPFRFISAAKHARQYEPELEYAMFRACKDRPHLPGETFILIDVSGSMDSAIAGRSEVVRYDAAAAIAMLARELCEHVTIMTFSESRVYVPPRRGFALCDAIVNSQPHGCTMLAKALNAARSELEVDRTIVITDEQSHDGISDPIGRGYLCNVAAYRNGVGYDRWRHIDGFSESTLEYIVACETATE